MANALPLLDASTTAAGDVIYTVPADTNITIIGLHATNVTDRNEQIWIKVRGRHYAFGTLIPMNGGYEHIEPGSKLNMTAGDELYVRSLTDGGLDLHVSYLEQTPDEVAEETTGEAA